MAEDITVEIENVRERLCGIFRENGLDIGKIVDDSKELDVDSLQFVSIIVDIENEFSITVPDEELDISKLRTFSDYLKLIPVNH